MTESTAAAEPMHLLVLGAEGRTGSAVVREVLAAGHRVTAVVPEGAWRAERHERLVLVAGDPTDQSAVDKAALGTDAVISVVQATDRRPTRRCSEAISTVVQTLLDAGGPRRVLCLSTAHVDPRTLPLPRRAYVALVVGRRHRNALNDLMRMEAELDAAAPDLDWTVLRPPTLTNGPVTGKYRFVTDAHLSGGRTLSRGDLGHFIARHLTDSATFRARVEIAY